MKLIWALINQKLGGLFGLNEHEQELAFHFAIDRINADRSILQSSTLVADVQRISDSDSFHGNKKGKKNTANDICFVL